MFDETQKLRMSATLKLLGYPESDLEELLITAIAEKMEQKKLPFTDTNKILVSAVCSYLESIENDYEFKGQTIYRDRYLSFAADKASYITTGVYFLAVIRDLVDGQCDEDIITVLGEAFIYVYKLISSPPPTVS